MKQDIQVCPRCGLAVVRLFGAVNGDDLCEVLDALIESEDWDPGQNDLWDLRALSDLFIAPGQVERLARRVPSEECDRGAGRTALITRTLTQRAYGTLFFDAINPSSRVHRSFYSERRAARWLLDKLEGEAETEPCGQDCLLAKAGDASVTGE